VNVSECLALIILVALGSESEGIWCTDLVEMKRLSVVLYNIKDVWSQLTSCSSHSEPTRKHHYTHGSIFIRVHDGINHISYSINCHIIVSFQGKLTFTSSSLKQMSHLVNCFY